MNPTGIVRRVDELGRITIPKEIRTRYKISETTPLELFVDDQKQQIMLQRYESLNDVSTMLSYALDAVTEDETLLNQSSMVKELRDKIVDVLEYSQKVDKARGR